MDDGTKALRRRMSVRPTPGPGVSLAPQAEDESEDGLSDEQPAGRFVGSRGFVDAAGCQLLDRLETVGKSEFAPIEPDATTVRTLVEAHTCVFVLSHRGVAGWAGRYA